MGRKHLPNNIHKMMIATAKAYPEMQAGGYKAYLEPIEKALDSLPDETAKNIIRKNLFEGIPMQCINEPCSIKTMQRYRQGFLWSMAREMRKHGLF